jgi:hypothetical protein
MIKQENDTLATKLLNSQDSKVAEAARRVFSNSSPISEQPEHTVMSSVTEPRDFIDTALSSDVQEAASAAIMLAPQHQQMIQLRQNGTSFDVATRTAVPTPLDSILSCAFLGKKSTTSSERVKRRYVVESYFLCLNKEQGDIALHCSCSSFFFTKDTFRYVFAADFP